MLVRRPHSGRHRIVDDLFPEPAARGPGQVRVTDLARSVDAEIGDVAGDRCAGEQAEFRRGAEVVEVRHACQISVSRLASADPGSHQLAVGAGAAVVFPEYDLSSEARYPVAIEQNFTVARWVVDQYTTDEAERAQITDSPLRATTEQLTGLPPVLVITGEADVLRDGGEAYADKRPAAGVPVTAVRFQGIIHDFVMLNTLRETPAAGAANTLATAVLRTALHAG
ncbi:alpha/beta hydrolase [Streptomyces platensis]|uniref:alpha/beta hydrolase n=1 Tax=Streptomyces platensis TaxID=58346 RepID=UPI00369C4779